jgi:hypothetical protein
MTVLLTNIDDVRARIMELESADVYDDQAWQRVLADLRAAGRVSAVADAERRMETAKSNQPPASPAPTLHAVSPQVDFLGHQPNGRKRWMVNGHEVITWDDYSHCLRCGRPLISETSRRNGYGEECLREIERESGVVISLRVVAVETEMA